MLATSIPLHDIVDVEGFVAATIERSGLRASLEETEREELMAEGLCILYELADRFEPHRAGYATSGRFSGFAAQFLPRRLGDAWHASHPEHRRIAGEDGKRRWHYHEAPISFDAFVAETPGSAGRAAQSAEGQIRRREDWAAVAPV